MKYLFIGGIRDGERHEVTGTPPDVLRVHDPMPMFSCDEFPTTIRIEEQAYRLVELRKGYSTSWWVYSCVPDDELVERYERMEADKASETGGGK